MKKKSFAKFLTVILAIIVLAMMAVPSVMAEEVTLPNRSITIHNTDDAAPLIRFDALDFHLGSNGGPYHFLAKVNVTGFAKVDSEADAAFKLVVKYGNWTEEGAFKLPDSQEVLASITADTAGWINLTNEDGSHIELDAIGADSDIMLEFVMENCSGTAAIGDMIIADSEDEIVYSLANDPHFTGISVFNRKFNNSADFLWEPAFTSASTHISVENLETYDYTPNYVLTMDIPTKQAEEITQGNAYAIVDFGDGSGTIFPTAKGPFTFRGMMKAEDIAPNVDFPDRAVLASFSVSGNGIQSYDGDTGGWIPLLQPDGTPIVKQAGSGWYSALMVSWGCTGKMAVADLEILDKDGNVVYSFATDTNLVEGIIPWRTSVSIFHLWAWDFNTTGSYIYSIADSLTTHTAEDYMLKTVEETYEPYVAPTEVPTATPTTEETPTATQAPQSESPQSESPQTGESQTSASIVVVALATAAAALIVSKKRSVRS
ncbi:MAG: LPXTG cell wall anchor domain-containing protein [Saccharofermentanales bacterium]